MPVETLSTNGYPPIELVLKLEMYSNRMRQETELLDGESQL